MTGQEIREARQKAGMSGELLADKLGVNAMTVYRWEKGKHKPAKIYIREIKRIFGIKDKVESSQ